MYVLPSRRWFLRYIGVGIGFGLSGCVSSPSERTETDAQGATETRTNSPTVATTAHYVLQLEIYNESNETVTVDVTMTMAAKTSTTESPDSILYDETVELAPTEALDLKPYRVDDNIRLRVASESKVVFEDLVEPHEGHVITFVSPTDVRVETEIE